MTNMPLVLALLALIPSMAAALTVADVIKSLDPRLTPENAAIVGVLGKTTDGLRDPNSLELADLYVKTAPDRVVGCMEFRAKNGFGGYNKGHSVWVMTVVRDKPNLLFSVDKANDWNKWCVGKDFTDKTDVAIRLIRQMNKN